MRYSKGEVTGIAAAIMAIAAIGTGMTVSDQSPHLVPSAVSAEPEPTASADPAPSDAAAPVPVPVPVPSPMPASIPPALTIKRILPISSPIRYGQWYWDEKNVPAGPLTITVDLEARVLSVWRGGYEIATTAVLLGSDEKPTPTGIFPITQKDAHHVSNLYDAPMPYMLRLTNDGVTIHATNVQNGYASHGCIGVPLDFAKKLFGIAHLGDDVVVTRGKQAGVGDRLTAADPLLTDKGGSY
jgi:lipoprotein-anchoring transpeptidase ErfK/SrfK